MQATAFIDHFFIREMISSKSTDSIASIGTEYEDEDSLTLPALSDVFDYIHSSAAYKFLTQFILPVSILLLLLKFSKYF